MNHIIRRVNRSIFIVLYAFKEVFLYEHEMAEGRLLTINIKS